MGESEARKTAGHTTPTTSPITMYRTLALTLALATATQAQRQPTAFATRPVPEAPLEVVEPENLSLFARLVGEETQARVIESINTWANDKAKENPGCVERFVCETYRTGETLSGIPYLAMSLTNAAVSFMVAEQSEEAIEMESITRAAKYGRMTGTCHRMECGAFDGQLREVTDWLAGLEEILGYVVNSVSTSLG